MTTQEVYEQMRAFFTRPEAKLGYAEDGTCVYRGGNDPKSDTRCAFGCVMPDELYRPEFEGTSAIALLTNATWPRTWSEMIAASELAAHFDGVEATFVDSAQQAHDSSESVFGFIEALDYLAEEFGLTVVA